jgi:hypothetical protein
MDAHHATADAGFRQLNRVRAVVFVPLPIVFEVYKRLVYDTRPEIARLALAQMHNSLEIVYPGADELDEVVEILDCMPTWGGSLEDALAAVTALQFDVPVWTFNYRDLGAFRNVHFWTPAPA